MSASAQVTQTRGLHLVTSAHMYFKNTSISAAGPNPSDQTFTDKYRTLLQSVIFTQIKFEGRTIDYYTDVDYDKKETKDEVTGETLLLKKVTFYLTDRRKALLIKDGHAERKNASDTKNVLMVFSKDAEGKMYLKALSYMTESHRTDADTLNSVATWERFN